jgi:polysaccharide pyruvyl transferase WcaK-like protein
MKNTRKVLLVNKGWADNLGDQAISYTMTKLLNENNCEVRFLDFTESQPKKERNYISDAQKEINKVEKQPLNTKIIRYFLGKRLIHSIYWWITNYKIFNKKSLEQNYSAAFIGGGQLILGSTIFPFAMYLWIRHLKKRNKDIKIFLVGVGVGGEFNFIDNLLYKKSFEKMEGIYLRDLDAISFLKEKFNIKANFIPDVAFCMSDFHNENMKKEDRVLVGITDYLVYKRYNQNKVSELEYMSLWEDIILDLQAKHKKVELFYTTSRDLVQTYKFKDYMQQKKNLNLKIVHTNNLEQLANEISVSETIVSGRMHGLIIGLSYGCEAIPFLISPKLVSFKEQYLDGKKNTKELKEETHKKIKKILTYVNL